jgi:RNA polymerase sigma-70 factor (ECF subfamily)
VAGSEESPPPVGETIEEFCRRTSPKLVGALTLQCGDRGVAEEVAQEAMARAWERWDEVARLDNPAGWTYRVAFNLAVSRGRSRQAERRAQQRALAGIRTEAAPASEADVPERIAVRAALAALPPRQRAAVVLRYYGQLSVAETAEAMGCAAGTVRALTAQGVDRLRAALPITDHIDLEVRDRD